MELVPENERGLAGEKAENMEGGVFMLKRYMIDVRDLSSEEKEAVRERVEGFAFMVCDVFGGSQGLIGLEVFWDRKEDFLSSPICPTNCHCMEI